MSEVRCFLITQEERLQISLRRFTYSTGRDCPKNRERGHDAWIVIEASASPALWGTFGKASGSITERFDLVPASDPRWPQVCAHCGEPFQLDDEWQLWRQWLFSGFPDGVERTMRDAELVPGAMWDMTEWAASPPGPDGRSYGVALPNGCSWYIDGRASNAPNEPRGWTRTGVAPLLTVRPSILAGSYHGFLTDGVLKEC